MAVTSEGTLAHDHRHDDGNLPAGAAGRAGDRGALRVARAGISFTAAVRVL